MPNAHCGSFLLWNELIATCKMKHLHGNSNPNRSITGKSVILIKSNQSVVDSITPHQIQCDHE